MKIAALIIMSTFGIGDLTEPPKKVKEKTKKPAIVDPACSSCHKPKKPKTKIKIRPSIPFEELVK